MKTTLRQQLEAFENGVFLDSDGSKDSSCFVFNDWFCKDWILKRKATALFKTTKLFAKMKDVDLDSTYVFFKNNCTIGGTLYDDFRICDVEFWGKDNNFEEPIKTGKTFTDLLV